MRQSRRARRMERHHKKAKSQPLNIIALMDILTILVFFLLVNSSSTQHIPSHKNLTLPVTSSKQAPEDTLIIEVTHTEILIQGVNVGRISDLLSDTQDTIPKLKEELLFLASSLPKPTLAEASQERKITVMGDENVSYDLIRKILTTCQQANFNKVAFAAMQTNKVKN
jgi:biopolymer transport protein ExbD